MLKFLKDREKLDFAKDYVNYSDELRKHLTIAHPAILATFMGYLKFQLRKKNSDKEVFFRGQTKNYDSITPSLLRGNDIEKINQLSKACQELKRRTQKLYSATRFQNETISNFFQHYGIKSQTLDLVDNLYVAIWFATNSWKKINGFENLCTYEQSEEEFGWIYFMEVDGPKEMNSNKINYDEKYEGFCDLRKFHSSLSARLHCQHGITYFRDKGKSWTIKNKNFNDLVIATVKFPNSSDFKMNGTIFTKEFLFPNSEIDNTYKLLKKDKFTKLLREIESEYNLDKHELGRIWNYNF